MLSRQVLLRPSRNFTRSIFKVDTVAHMHFGCSHSLKITSTSLRQLKNYRRNVLSSDLQIRYESSTAQQTMEQTKPAVEPIPEPPVPLSDVTESAVETLAGEPTFASLGLGSWWPPGMVQNSLEFLHVTCGLPWWASVVCGTLLIRLCLFPVVVLAQRNVAKLNNNLPEMQQIQMRLTDARQRGDSYGAAKYSAELMQFMNEKNMNPLKNMIPPLVQAPVFISVFMGLRGMAYLPVESLKTGGMLWFTDLTTPDQFYILPIVTSATLYFTIKLGADSGQTTQNMVLMKYFLTAIPVIMVPFTINFPGLLLVYWTTTNFISLAQVGFLRIPGVREYCKIEKLIKHQSNTMPIKDKGFINNVKDAWTNLKITSELEQRSHADKMAFMQAGRDPIKKTYKYDPTKIRPSATAIQAKTK